MKSIILSCTPTECEKIVNGDMSILVRKKVPKETPFKVYVYETQGATETPWVDEDGHFIYKGRGKIIGAFICCGIMQPLFSLRQMAKASCSTEEALAAYANGKPLYGLHISALKIYDKPKELHEFRACNFKSMNGTDVCGNYDCKYYQDSGSYMIPPSCAQNGCRVTRPPKNYIYVEE